MVPNPATYRMRNYKNVFDGGRKTLLCCIHPVSSQLAFTCSKSTQERCEICSKLTIKAPEQNDVILVSLLLTLNRFHKLFWCLHC